MPLDTRGSQLTNVREQPVHGIFASNFHLPPYKIEQVAIFIAQVEKWRVFPSLFCPFVSLCTLRYNKSIDLLQRRVYRVRNQVCSLSPFTTVMKEQKSFRKFYWIRFWDLRNLWNDRNLVEWIFLKNYCILERYVWNMFECKECGFEIELVELFSSFFNLIQYN